VKTAVKKALAKELDVEESGVTVTAKESRRLADASPRQLAGTWKIDFEVTAPAAKVTAVQSKVTALNKGTDTFKKELGDQLKAAGVGDAAVAAMKLSSFTAKKEGCVQHHYWHYQHRYYQHHRHYQHHRYY